jgi:hypothetical protein
MSLLPEIERTVREANQVDLDQLDPRSLGLLIEINQRFIEYLDALEIADFKICTSVTAKVDGTSVRFPNTEQFSDWLSEQL